MEIRMILYRRILIIVITFLFSGQAAHAENALQKSFELLKGVLENQQNNRNDGQTDSVNDILSNTEAKINKQNSLVFWNHKADFLTDVSKGKMAGYDRAYLDEEKNAVLNSIRAILANDYQTMVPEGKGERGCEVAFDVNVDELLKLYTRDKIERLGNNPPDFIASSSENVPNSAKANFSGLDQNCSKDVLGLKLPPSFINALASLLKEYGEVTETYVNKLRMDKVAAYQTTLQQEAELAKQKAKQDEQAKRTEQINEKLKQKEQARMDTCLVSPAYKLSKASSEVYDGLKFAVNARQAIKKEQEIGEVSGYVNATRLNELGRAAVYLDDIVKSNYADYKKYGGKASTPNKVVPLANPCH